MVKVWAGDASHDFRYIKRSLPGLLASGLPDEARVIIVDDQSTHKQTLELLQELAKDPRVMLWRNHERMGPNTGHAYNFSKVVETFPDAQFYAIVDDDIIYHPGWLQRTLQVHDEARARGIAGIMASLNVPYREHYDRVDLPTSTVLLKERQMALNWVIPRDIYEKVGPFRDIGIAYDSDYANRMRALQVPVICLKPSWVQNIGYFGAYQSNDKGKAQDYIGQVDWYLRSRDTLFVFRNAAERVKESAAVQNAWPYVKRLLGRS
jgi:GT2 family glycosyltransferase